MRGWRRQFSHRIARNDLRLLSFSSLDRICSSITDIVSLSDKADVLVVSCIRVVLLAISSRVFSDDEVVPGLAIFGRSSSYFACGTRMKFLGILLVSRMTRVCCGLFSDLLLLEMLLIDQSFLFLVQFELLRS